MGKTRKCLLLLFPQCMSVFLQMIPKSKCLFGKGSTYLSENNLEKTTGYIVKMDIAAKEVLVTQKTKIKENLLLSDKMLDYLEETGTLTEENAQEIKAKNTNAQKIDMLLCDIKLRGERAFDNFIAAIKSDPVYETLATDLEKEYAKLCHKPERNGQVTFKPDLGKDYDSNNVKLKVSSADSVGQSVPDVKLQHNLHILYTPLKAHMTSLNMRELSFTTPKPITFQMVIDLQDQYMKSIDECYHILGVKDKTKSLRSHIVDLKAKERQMDDEIKEKEFQRNKLSHQYIKLENKHREMNRELQKELKLNRKLAEKVDEMTAFIDSIKVKEGEIEKFKVEKGKLQETLETIPDDCTTIFVENNAGVPRFNRDIQGKRKNTCASLNTRKNSIQSRAKPINTKGYEKSCDKLGQNGNDFEWDYKCNPQVKFDQSLRNDINDIPFLGFSIGNRGAEIPDSHCNPESSSKGSPRNVPRQKAPKRKKKRFEFT